jgi:hypothetical protein
MSEPIFIAISHEDKRHKRRANKSGKTARGMSNATEQTVRLGAETFQRQGRNRGRPCRVEPFARGTEAAGRAGR